MIKNIKYLFCILPVLLLWASCSKDNEPFDHPFFHINFENRSAVEVLKNRRDTVEYKVYLSAKLQFEPVELRYEIVTGDGLQEGRDFELLTKGNTMNFSPGIFERPIRIAWKQADLDTTKNNTLTVRLLSNSKNYTIGMPGPDGLQRELVFTKK